MGGPPPLDIETPPRLPTAPPSAPPRPPPPAPPVPPSTVPLVPPVTAPAPAPPWLGVPLSKFRLSSKRFLLIRLWLALILATGLQSVALDHSVTCLLQSMTPLVTPQVVQ